MSDLGLFYSGIGSRRAPAEKVAYAEAIARRLAALGWTLRSGRAPGMDQGFEAGAGRNAIIYLPQAGFSSYFKSQAATVILRPTAAAYKMASRFHPAWDRCSDFAQACHARNCHQVLGYELNEPSKHLLCWTPGGKDVGGTATALRVARAHGVPIYNLAIPEDLRKVESLFAVIAPKETLF